MWRSPLVLGGMGRVAGPLLGGGIGVRLFLNGTVPNGRVSGAPIAGRGPPLAVPMYSY